jgi:regulatory protein
MRRRHAAPSPAPPESGQLRAAALAHLARFAATEASLTRVLHRKLDRWLASSGHDKESAQAEIAGARKAVADIVRQLVASGAVNDAQFADSRARSLIRAGRSRRAVGAHLAARGVAAELAAAALPADENHELAAALIHARKRRLGPWRKQPATPEILRRELGSLARAGFPGAIASAALRYAPEEADALIAAFRAEI